MKIKYFTIFGAVFVLFFSLLLFLIISLTDSDSSNGIDLENGGLTVSNDVLKHRSLVEKYCKEYDIEEYVHYILAIIQVESGGSAVDVMQSSESLGLPPNTLSTEESIKQGCKYFSELLANAEKLGCDIKSVVQSYNFGGRFLHYIASNGKKYTYELAESFSKEKANGEKVNYPNPVAIPINGGWRYAYGVRP